MTTQSINTEASKMVVSVNISEKKGTPKTPIEKASFKEDYGIIGDAHAGPGIRQVSLLSKESIDEFRNHPLLKVPITHGSFAENITTSGIDYSNIRLGSRLIIGDVVLEITKIGKECLTPCAIGQSTGACIMPKEGVFAKVINGGEVKVSDEIKVDF